jgi:hypothetical protein
MDDALLFGLILESLLGAPLLIDLSRILTRGGSRFGSPVVGHVGQLPVNAPA